MQTHQVKKWEKKTKTHMLRNMENNRLNKIWHVKNVENIWKEKEQCVLKCGEKQTQPLKYVEKGRHLQDIWRKGEL